MENNIQSPCLSSEKLKQESETSKRSLSVPLSVPISGKEIRRRASKGYSDLLENKKWQWQWYATLTFTEEIHPEQADKCFKRWVRWINQETYGKRSRIKGKGITWVRGLEYQRRHVIHFHALISGLLENFNRFIAMMKWENTGEKCGFARIYPYQQGAGTYLSKYVSKGGEIDMDIPEDRRKLNLFTGMV